LRYIDAFPVETKDGEMIALRDPLGVATESLVLSHAGLMVIQCFNGESSTKEIVRRFKRAGNMSADLKSVNGLAAILDENYFLDNKRFRERKAQLERNLLKAGVRKMSHAGVSYPASAAEFTKLVGDFFTDEKGAGLPGPVNGYPTPSAIISPHIDFRIGGPTYTHAYRRMAESQPADVYIILGTGHGGLSELYSVLPVDFETPLGILKTDKQFIADLQQRCDSDLFADAFLHKHEHVIEFQAVLLKQIFGNKNIKIVPILCSFSHLLFNNQRFAKDRKKVDKFVEALRGAIASYPGKVSIIASVDLAHVGPRYGDPEQLDPAFLQRVEQEDKNALAHVTSVNPGGWVEAISGVDDKYRVCGFSSIYTLLSCTTASKGDVLHYEKGRMDDDKSFVSYCSAVLYD